MSRQNKRRGIYAEAHLAERIAAERDARGWTNDGLAHRMTDAGCPMVGSAIFKIEKGAPPRRIVVDELVTFAKVFSLTIEELLLPPEVAASKELMRLVVAWDTASNAAATAVAVRDAAGESVQAFIGSRRTEAVMILEKWASSALDDGISEDTVSYRMWKLTGSPEWFARAKAALDRSVAEDN